MDRAVLDAEDAMRLSVREVAARFGVPENTVFHWVERDHLPATQVDGQYRFNPAAIYEWATARGVPIAGNLFGESGVEHAGPPLTDALRRGGVVVGLSGNDKRAVLTSAVQKLTLPAHADREVILQMLLAREKLGSTGIGEGFAIPHVRDPIVLRVGQPLVTLFLLDHPIDFGAVDKRPVHTLFLAITPTIQTHLLILSRLGTVLLDPRVRDAIKGKEPAEKILGAIEEAERRLGDRGEATP